jgi:mitochondrial fission protein ELM1
MAERAIWAITDGKIGMVNQAVGLADAIARFAGNFVVEEKTVVPAQPWSLLPAGMWPRWVLGSGEGSTPLQSPWPDVVVSCGRHAIGPALWIKWQSGGRAQLIHAQHPRTAAGAYDAIIVQSHDGLDGPNVIKVMGSMHRITEGDLVAAVARQGTTFEDIPHPTFAVLIGGTNSTYHLTTEIVRRLADDLQGLVARSGCGLLVTASRRTGEENLAMLRQRLAGPNIYFWDETGENPYVAFLAQADSIFVTGDSVNMVSEACFTGKPVHVLALEGGAGSKFERFHAEMCAADYTRPFQGELEEWQPVQLDETSRAAREIITRLAL